MKLRALVLVGIVGLLGSCLTSEPLILDASVQKVEPGKEFSDFATSYALPRTVVHVKVLAEKTTTKPGPFAAYAERLLGIESVPTRETSEWGIKSISLSTTGQRDPEQVYMVSSKGASRADRLQLNHEGVLLGVNLPPPNTGAYDLTNIRLNNSGDMVIPGYPDLTIRKHTEPMLDTVYRTFRTDTSFIRLPILQQQISTKTLMNQAEEAASVIMTLRERKYWLMNGEFVIEEGLIPLPDGHGLKIMLDEMSKMEYDYVSLFVGRQIKETKQYEFSYIPGNEGVGESVDIFSFSSFSGVLPAGNSNGDPVKLRLDPASGFTGPKLNVNTGNSEDDSKGKGLAYRIPGQAEVSVSQLGEELIKETFLIAQYGVINFLPKKLLSQPDIMIRIHPELGNLEGIYEK